MAGYQFWYHGLDVVGFTRCCMHVLLAASLKAVCWTWFSFGGTHTIVNHTLKPFTDTTPFVN